MSREVTIVCDRCGVILGAGRTALAAESDMKQAGGRRVGRRDYCADCVPATKTHDRAASAAQEGQGG